MLTRQLQSAGSQEAPFLAEASSSTGEGGSTVSWHSLARFGAPGRQTMMSLGDAHHPFRAGSAGPHHAAWHSAGSPWTELCNENAEGPPRPFGTDLLSARPYPKYFIHVGICPFSSPWTEGSSDPCSQVGKLRQGQGA